MTAEADPIGPSESTAGGPLAGCRVVVTRSVEDNRSLGQQLTELGAEVIAWPMTEVVEPADGGIALREAVARLADYRYVVLTSANGVRAVAAALGDEPWPAGSVVKPVGPVTAALAVAHGMMVDHPPNTATAESLVEAMPPAAPGGDPPLVLAPLAELAGETVVYGLEAKGYVVDRVEAYRTVAPETPGWLVGDAGGGPGDFDRVDALTFFSPSAVDRLVDLVGADPLTAARLTVCIGPATGARASGRGLANVVVADPHTEAGVVTRLVAAIGTT